MAAHDTEPSHSLHGVACAGHVFAAHVRADPGMVWTALTGPGQTAGYLYGLAAHSTWVPGHPIEFRLGGRAGPIGRVLHARCGERLSYLLQAGPVNSPVYLTWRLRPAQAGARSGWRSTSPTAPVQPRTRKISGCPSSPRCRPW